MKCTLFLLTLLLAAPFAQGAFDTGFRTGTAIRAAGQPGAADAAALEKRCRIYGCPLCADVWRGGHNTPDAQDLTQEFFARFLGTAPGWKTATPPKAGSARLCFP